MAALYRDSNVLIFISTGMFVSSVSLSYQEIMLHNQDYFTYLKRICIFYGGLTATATVSSTHHQSLPSSLLETLNHQRADSRSKKTYNLQPVEQKPHLQKDRQDEKAEGYIPDEGTRKKPQKNN